LVDNSNGKPLEYKAGALPVESVILSSNFMQIIIIIIIIT